MQNRGRVSRSGEQQFLTNLRWNKKRRPTGKVKRPGRLQSGGIREWGAVLCAAAVAGIAGAACLGTGFFFNEKLYRVLPGWFALCGLLAACNLLVLFIGRLRGIGHIGRIGRIGSIGHIERRPHVLNGGIKRIVEGEQSGNTSFSFAAGLAAGPCVIAALYLAALFRGPVSVEGTLNELLRWAFYASFAVMAGTAALGGGRARLILRAGWHAAGQCLAWSGLLAYTGVLDLPHALLYSNDPAVSVSGVRVGGLLQYPNTYGAVMAAFLLERLFSAARRIRRLWDGEDVYVREAGRLRKSARVRHAARLQYSARMRLAVGALLPLFPYAAALRLSESRGAWLAAAVAAAAALALQRRLAAPLLLAAAPPAAAAFYCWPAAAGPAFLPPLAGAALGWAGSLAAGLWMLRRAQANAAGRAACAAAAVCWTAAGGAVLALLRARLAAPSSTADARAVIYRDALRLAREQPWLGQGGETWRSLYLAVQSQPYVGSRTHSGYLDIVLDVGVAGLAAIILLIIAPGLYRLRRHPHLFAAYAVLAAHAAADFDWSYSLVWMLLFWLPALVEPSSRLAAPASSPGAICTAAPSEQIPPAPGDRPFPARDQTPSIRFLRVARSSVPKSAVSVLLRLSLIAICLGLAAESFQMLASYKLYQEAQRMGQNAFTHYSPVKSKLQQTAQGHLAPAHNWPELAHGRPDPVQSRLGLAYRQPDPAYCNPDSAPSRPDPAHRQSDPAAALLRQALAHQPASTRAARALAVRLPDRAAKEVLREALRYSPKHPGLQWELARIAGRQDEPGPALREYRKALALDAFNRTKQTAAVGSMLDLSERLKRMGRQSDSEDVLRGASELLRGYRLLAQGAGGLDGRFNDRNFALTQEAAGYGRRLEQHFERR